MSLLNKPNPMVITPDDEVMALIWDRLSGAMKHQLALKGFNWKPSRANKKMASAMSLLTWARVCEVFPHYATEIRKNSSIVIGAWR